LRPDENLPVKKQWYGASSVERCPGIGRGLCAYSYGDSAGFTPDFPFNPPLGETKVGTKIGNGDNISKSNKIFVWFGLP